MSARRWSALGVLAAGAALLAGACRAVLGVEDPPAVQCGGLVITSNACATCMDEACCSASSACASSDACRATADSVLSCTTTDPDCRAARTPLVPPEGFDELARCQFASCNTACAACGGLVDAFGPACDRCVQAYCCDDSAACAADAECTRRFRCIHDCDVLPDCTGSCLLDPAKNALADEFQSCIAGSCTEECRIGFDLDCVQGFGWGHATEDTTIKYTVSIVELLDQEPVPGATLMLCDALTGTCQEGTTTPSGEWTFDVPLTKGQAFGSTLRIGAEGYLRMLAVSNRFLAHDTKATFFTISVANFAFLVEQFDLKLDEDKAMVIATALDCRGFGAQNIRFDLSPGQPGATSYFQAPGVKRTNKTGTAVFGNVPLQPNEKTGILNVKSVLVDPDTGQDVRVHGGIIVPIETNLITQVQIYPGTN